MSFHLVNRLVFITPPFFLFLTFTVPHQSKQIPSDLTLLTVHS